MARLTYKERISRLEQRYNELVKPTFVIAEKQGEGIAAVIILSNGKKQSRRFPSVGEFETFVEQTTNCNIIVDNSVLTVNGKTLESIMSGLDNESLQQIAEDKASPDDINSVLYKGIVARL